ncbi:MAG: hypothetical protein WA012_05920, partial [Rhodoferax sp.]|uniref:hypothetical protein n=1 Tax=Rhodoferax sp. TaxID=50421 RepID=UPI003BB76AD5
IHDFRLHGLPRYARSDANNTVIARNVVTWQSHVRYQAGCSWLSLNTLRHCEQSEAIHDFRLHGLPRYARSDANNTVIARNVVTWQSHVRYLA